MNKPALVEALRELAQLCELDGDNAFKINALDKGARALEEYDADLEQAIEEDSLTDIEGIGKGIAQRIKEFAHAGKMEELEELRKKFPAGLVEMTKIPGFGAKKVRAVHEELGIDTVEDLKTACEDGRLAKLKGFGEKTAEKVLAGIEQRARYTGLFRVSQALKQARVLLEKLREHKAVKAAEIGGSLRRGKEIVKDIDIVAATKSPKEVMDFFVGLPEVTQIIGHGETKSSIQLAKGIQADLRCVSPEEYPYALVHFTGSKEHNTRLRGLAKDKGLKLNEYGLFRDKSEKRLSASEEKDVYKHLGLAYIPPELREDRGEIEAAAENRLPRLVEQKDLRGYMHMHTHYSDGQPEVEDYAKWAAGNGVEWMGIADHSESLKVVRGLTEERVLEQHKEIDAINKRYAKKGVRLLKGIECDILQDGKLDYSGKFRKNFEFVVASVHSYFNLTEKEQTRRIIKALENPDTTILGHITGRVLLARDGYAVDQKEVIRQAAKLGVAIEINGGPERLELDWRLIPYALEQGCRLSLGPDAHDIERLKDIPIMIRIARKGWVQPEHVLNTLSAGDFLAFAAGRKK